MTDVPLDIRVALLRAHGNFPQAYSATYQPGLSHFGDARGFIAYRKVGGTTMALADPVTSAERLGDLVADFVREFRDVVFCQSSRRVADVLASMQFRVNEMGLETRLDLAHYTFDGHAKEHLRRAHNRIVKLRYEIKECATDSIGRTMVDAVSRHWRNTRTLGSRSLKFLLRPIVIGDEPDVRKFYAFDASGKLVAFIFFDPVYQDGNIVGYTDQFRQRLPEADPKVSYAITYRAIETFQKEGRRWLFLGLSPLAAIDDKEFEKDWLVRRGFRFMYESAVFNRFIYPLQGHFVHKQRYGGESEQTYFAFNTLPSLPRLIKFLRVCGVI
jgi:lysylphosphatidylglycerol synthetase-like protein (DUF2156 family)